MNNLNNKISAGTIARTACLLLALTNQILSPPSRRPHPREGRKRGRTCPPPQW